MSQTPVHEQHNPDLLRFVPSQSKKIIEIGCSSGALAREFKALHPDCDYVGIEIDDTYTSLAKRHCDRCLTLDIENAPESFWHDFSDRDCWIFGDTLEHLRDPWQILRKIRSNISNSGSVVACIPNIQHWSIQAQISIGDFRYQSSGLLDITHLRWFTRKTIIEMFDQTGFEIVSGLPRIFDEPGREIYLAVIEQMAKAAGSDPQVAVTDAMPLQYVVHATPKRHS